MSKRRDNVNPSTLITYGWKIPDFSAVELMKRVGVKGRGVPDKDVIVDSLFVRDGQLHVRFSIIPKSIG